MPGSAGGRRLRKERKGTKNQIKKQKMGIGIAPRRKSGLGAFLFYFWVFFYFIFRFLGRDHEKRDYCEPIAS